MVFLTEIKHWTGYLISEITLCTQSSSGFILSYEPALLINYASNAIKLALLSFAFVRGWGCNVIVMLNRKYQSALLSSAL